MSVNIKQNKASDNENMLLIETTVKDHGIGILDDEIEKIFEPFWKSENFDSENLNKRGHGFGLSICKQICQSLGGDIEAHSNIG